MIVKSINVVGRRGELLKLFKKDAVFVSDKNPKEVVFEEVANELFKKGYVKDDFYEKLVERESKYPTGMDMKVVDEELPNIAIPHTESEYVNETLIAPIKLEKKVKFNNMINPEESLEVSYLFMILNDQKEKQANILAGIMDFLNSTDSKELKEFFEYEDTEDIYDFLTNKF